MGTEKHIPSGSRLPGVSSPVEILEIGGKGMPVELIIRNGKIYCYNESGQTLIDNGIIQTMGIAARSIVTTHLSVGAAAFTHNITHYALNYYQVYFYSGTIYWANGQNLTISAGWLNILATTYLYVEGSDPIMSASTSPADAVGTGKTLIAICRPGSSWGKYATVEYQNAAGTTIDGGVITTNTINAQKLNVISIDASGYINATYINAGTLSVGGSGSISPSALYFLDSNNAIFGKVNTLGLIFGNSKGIILHNVDEAGNPAGFYNDANNYAWLIAGLGNKIIFGDNDGNGQISMDLATKIIRCDGLGNYYLVGGIGSKGSVILKDAIAFQGNGYANVSVAYNFGVTLTGYPLVWGTGLGEIIPTKNYETGLDTGYPFATSGSGSANTALAQQFTAPKAMQVASVSVLTAKTGTPAGTMYAEIQTDSGGLPSGTVITNGTSDSISCNVASTYSNFGMSGFVFSTPPSLTNGTIYHIVIKTSGFTRNAGVTDLYLGGDAGGSHTGDGETYTTSWAAISPATVLYYRVYEYPDNLGATQLVVSTDFFTVMGEDPSTTSIYLQFAQLEITVNVFNQGTRYGALIGVFGNLP